jgi:cathepsin D
MSKFGVDPLLVSIFNQGKIIDPTFSFKLSSSGAEMYVGGANSMLYKGDITYTRVTQPVS